MNDRTKELLIIAFGSIMGLFLAGLGTIILCYRVEFSALGIALISVGTSTILTVLGLDIGLNFIPHAKIRLESTKQALGIVKAKPPANSTVSSNDVRKITRDELETKAAQVIATLAERAEKGELPFLSKK